MTHVLLLLQGGDQSEKANQETPAPATQVPVTSEE